MAGPALIGPWNPVSGTPNQYKFGPETQWVYVRNQTHLTLLVVFSETQPKSLNSLSNEYDNVVREGGELLMWTQSRGASTAERSLNAVGAFTGSVWIMPVDLSSTLASTGTTSSTNNVWVGAGGPYDPPPPVSAGIPLGTDLTSQPRVIALPMTVRLADVVSDQTAIPAAGISAELTSYGVGSLIVAGITRTLQMYLYMLTVGTTFGAAGAGGVVFSLIADLHTAGHASVGTVGGFNWPAEIYRFTLSWPAAGGPYQSFTLPLSYPIAISMGLLTGSNIDHFAFMLKSFATAGSLPANAEWSLAAALDTANISTDGSLHIPGPIGRPDDLQGLF